MSNHDILVVDFDTLKKAINATLLIENRYIVYSYLAEKQRRTGWKDIRKKWKENK